MLPLGVGLSLVVHAEERKIQIYGLRGRYSVVLEDMADNEQPATVVNYLTQFRSARPAASGPST